MPTNPPLLASGSLPFWDELRPEALHLPYWVAGIIPKRVGSAGASPGCLLLGCTGGAASAVRRLAHRLPCGAALEPPRRLLRCCVPVAPRSVAPVFAAS